MLVQEFIRKKRDRKILEQEEIIAFCRGVTDETVGEAQIAAFCMATLLNGLNTEERVALTMGMAGSGIIVDWDAENLGGPVLDKHSTGGVGDKVSLMLAPMVAACGGFVPMISGRGLGHTGGTLDKMDAIPGYTSQPDLVTLKKVVKETGCAVVGATKDIAPADRIMYAVRDVTATVESIDLITASILSKKLAAGLDGLVLDVKFGTGAFMQTYEDAKKLAETLASVSNGAGMTCRALLTDMNQVLGDTAGNAIEVREAIEYLRGDYREPRLHNVTLSLTATLLVLGGLFTNEDEARDAAAKALESGQAAEIFAHSVAALGGPADIMEGYKNYLPLAGIRREIHAEQSGTVSTVNTRALGIAVIELGGGRRLTSDKIDHSVGLEKVAGPGDQVGPGNKPLAVIYGTDNAKISKAEALIKEAFVIDPDSPALAPTPVIRETVGG